MGIHIYIYIAKQVDPLTILTEETTGQQLAESARLHRPLTTDLNL